MKVICGERKQEYFFKRGWTPQISLIRLRKLDFARKCAGGGASIECSVTVIRRLVPAFGTANVCR